MLHRAVVVAAAICLAAVANIGVAFAQVVVGPGEQTISPGSETEFVFQLQRNGADVAIFGFNIVISTGVEVLLEPVLKPDGAPGEIDCTVEPDLDGDVDPLVFHVDQTDDDREVIAVSFGDFAFPLSNIARDGLIGRCKFRVRSDAPPGDYTLTCDPSPGATSAADAEGNEVDVVCEDGVLSIEPCNECVTLGSVSVGAGEVSPEQPEVGGVVTFTFPVSAFVLSVDDYMLEGGAPVLAGDEPVEVTGDGVVFRRTAAAAGTATVRLRVDYTTEEQCEFLQGNTCSSFFSPVHDSAFSPEVAVQVAAAAPTPTPTPVSFSDDDDAACHIARSGNATWSWMLVASAAVIVLRRRRLRRPNGREVGV